MSYSKGIMWLDDCRIPFVDDGDKDSAKPLGKTLKHKGWDTEKWLEETKEAHTQGRFTPNLLVCDDMLNDGSVGGSSFCPPTKYEYESSKDKFNSGGRRTKTGIGDKGTNSRYYDLDLWFDKMIERLGNNEITG